MKDNKLDSKLLSSWNARNSKEIIDVDQEPTERHRLWCLNTLDLPYTVPDFINWGDPYYSTSDENIAHPHWQVDTLEFANQRLAILKHHFKDNVEALNHLENLEFQLAIDFTTWEKHPTLFLKDTSVMGKFAYIFEWKGLNTRNAYISTSVTPEEESYFWIYRERDENWNLLLGNHAFFSNDLTGLDSYWNGILRLREEYRWFWAYYVHQWKTLLEIKEHLLSIDALDAFLSFIPWKTNMERIFLLNIPLSGWCSFTDDKDIKAIMGRLPKERYSKYKLTGTHNGTIVYSRTDRITLNSLPEHDLISSIPILWLDTTRTWPNRWSGLPQTPTSLRFLSDKISI